MTSTLMSTEVPAQKSILGVKNIYTNMFVVVVPDAGAVKVKSKLVLSSFASLVIEFSGQSANPLPADFTWAPGGGEEKVPALSNRKPLN